MSVPFVTSVVSSLVQETADMLKSHMEDSASPEVYESMSASSQEMLMKYSGGSEDVYESMLEIDPECAEDLCKSTRVADWL